MDKEYKYKIVLLGNFCVGKTSLIRKFVFNLFDDKYLTTIGVNISKKNIRFQASKNTNDVLLLIWDINGTNGFSKITPQYLSGASGAIIVADVMRPDTLNELKPKIDEYRTKNPKGHIIVALNKSDLLSEEDGEREKVIEAFNDLFPNKEIQYLFTSAKTGFNVELLFLNLVRKIISGRNE